MYGIHRRANNAVSAAIAASRQNASRHVMCSASNVPAGTPSMFATVCPVTMAETARASLPFCASSFAISVAVPKNAPCGRPARNRAVMSIGAFTAAALNALPAKAMIMKMTMRVRGGILRPNTRMSVPTHTPIAYAEMKLPANGMLTCIVCAACGRMPIITNSAAPSTNAPEASASRPSALWDCAPPLRWAAEALFGIFTPHLCVPMRRCASAHNASPELSRYQV